MPSFAERDSRVNSWERIRRAQLWESIGKRCGPDKIKRMSTPAVTLPNELRPLLHKAVDTLDDVEELFRGTLNQASVYPREVVKRALAHNAAAIILAHNHPSGIAEPSHADENLTQALKAALALVDVRVLDHFIVGCGETISFAERGLL